MKNSIVSQMLECLQRFCVQQKKIKSNVNAIYVKRHHNDRYNNPAIEQTPKIESMPYYFMAIDNAKKGS